MFLSKSLARSLFAKTNWCFAQSGLVVLFAALGTAVALAQGNPNVPGLGTAVGSGLAVPGARNAASSPAGTVEALRGVTAPTAVSAMAQRPQDGRAADTRPADGRAAKAPESKDTDERAPSSRGAMEADGRTTDFQEFVRASNGQSLRLYGYDLFSQASFGSTQSMPVPDNYVLGPGDELSVLVTGLVEFDQKLVIDRNGRVIIPKVGPLVLAGVSYSNSESVLSEHIGKVYRNFKVTVTMGRLRSVEIFALGQAHRPGKHFVSSLSSLVNAMFETGGPSVFGGLRAVELRRAGKTIATLDVYRFLAFGEAGPDVKLSAGDVLFYPPAGPRAAIMGVVNAPAIYELKPNESIGTVLQLSGGMSALAAPQRAQLERINSAREIARYVEDLALDEKGLATKLQAGDMLTVFPISPQIGSAVTLQGNVAAPLRYRFQTGMRVSDLLNDSRLLIPGSYWAALNSGAVSQDWAREEVNLDYATIQRLDRAQLRTRLIAFNLRKAMSKDATENLALEPGDIVTVYKPGESGADTDNTVTLNGQMLGGSRKFVWRAGTTIQDLIPSAQWLIEYYNYWQRQGTGVRRAGGIVSGSAEFKSDINWEYAQVIRRRPTDLRSEVLTFNLGAAITGKDAGQNLKLEPGDVITLYTLGELGVPIGRRTRIVSLQGEVKVPGQYQLRADETLTDLLARAGGLTPQAYLYGLEFRRESVRLTQQDSLEKLVRRVESQILSEAQTRLQNVTSKEQSEVVQAGLQADQVRVENLKRLRASGRMALDLDPSSPVLPRLLMEDGDVVVVPPQPAFVGIFGAVVNENSLLWRPGIRVADLVDRSGRRKAADVASAVVLRADGTAVLPRRNTGWVFASRALDEILMPGDTVFVPELEDRETAYSAFIRGAKDITQVFYQFGLGAAALKTIRN